MNKFRVSSGLMLMALIAMGCQPSDLDPFKSGTQVESAEDTAAKYTPHLPPNSIGLRASVQVSAFITGDEAKSEAQWEITDSQGNKQTIKWGVQEQQSTGRALADQLQSMMGQTDYFLVNVRGETFDSQKEEHQLGEEGWVTEEVVEKGGLVSPDLFVKATITEWTPNAGGKRSILGGLTKNFLGAAVWKKSKSRVGLQLQIVNRKQQIVATVPVRVEATSTDFTAGALSGLSGAIVGGALSQYANTTMEEAISQAIKVAVERIVPKIPKRYYKHQL